MQEDGQTPLRAADNGWNRDGSLIVHRVCAEFRWRIKQGHLMNGLLNIVPECPNGTRQSRSRNMREGLTVWTKENVPNHFDKNSLSFYVWLITYQ